MPEVFPNGILCSMLYACEINKCSYYQKASEKFCWLGTRTLITKCFLTDHIYYPVIDVAKELDHKVGVEMARAHEDARRAWVHLQYLSE